MLVVGIVGSPRKNGRTNELIGAVLEGAAEAGAETQAVYLIDHDVRPFTGAGGSDDAFRFCPEELSALCEQADALAFGAPVYFGVVNGLSRDFMDTVRIRNSNGKPAVGTAIAGGSGKGLLSGLQNMYHWLYHRQFRAIDPLPVSRFNLDETLAALKVSGTRLVEMAGHVVPFAGERRDDRWADVLTHYAALPYLDKDPLDEFVLLARQLIAISEGPERDRAVDELHQALALIERGRRSEAAPHAVAAYELLCP
jgi:NAD(P)H-dependent FMN reductase